MSFSLSLSVEQVRDEFAFDEVATLWLDAVKRGDEVMERELSDTFDLINNAVSNAEIKFLEDLFKWS